MEAVPLLRTYSVQTAAYAGSKVLAYPELNSPSTPHFQLAFFVSRLGPRPPEEQAAATAARKYSSPV
jgi:hypothetical protein